MSDLIFCRLCGTCGHHNLDILDRHQSSDRFTLREKIFECVGVRVQRFGGMTTKICQRCHDKITEFHDFRELCIATDIWLSQRMKLEISTQKNSIDDEAKIFDSSPTCSVSVAATTSAFGPANTNHNDTNDSNDETDDNTNSATMELDLNSLNDDNINSPPAEEVMMEKIQIDDRNVVQAGMWSIVRPVGGVHGNPNRRSRPSKMRIACASQHWNIIAAPAERKRIKCSYPNCTKSYTLKHNLKAHMETIHLHSGKTFDCTICSKEFKYKRSIRPHMATKHGQGIQYCCYLCHAPKYDKQTLKRHMNLQHTGKSLFHCSVCGKGFTANAHLQRHMKTH